MVIVESHKNQPASLPFIFQKIKTTVCFGVTCKNRFRMESFQFNKITLIAALVLKFNLFSNLILREAYRFSQKTGTKELDPFDIKVQV